jgi:ATP-dependent 26S proteasome regulatory subunit
MPLPDDEGRSRLLDLYGKGLQLELRDQTHFIAATEGTTPAFIREVLRRAALLAVERGDENRVTDELLKQAVDELRDGADQLTSTLLGAQADSQHQLGGAGPGFGPEPGFGVGSGFTITSQ